MIQLSECKLHMAGPQDAEALLSLINLVQPEIPWSKEHLLWQFFNEIGNADLFTLRDGKKIVALYVAVRKNLMIHGQVKPAFMIQDVMTHPDYRGRGFLHYLANVCFDNLQQNGYIGYTFPNKLSENSFRRSSWVEVMAVPRRSFILLPSSQELKSTLRVTEIKNYFSEEVTDIWLNAKLGVGVHRDQAFLNWRYNKPNTQYFKFMIEGKKGFLVLKLYIEKNGERVMHICDLVVKHANQSLVMPTLNFVKEFALTKNASLITAWLPDKHPYEKAYNLFGIRKEEECDRYFFVTPQVKANAVIGVTNPNDWHLTQGDSDVY